MSKIDINKVAEILQHNKIEPTTLRRIIEEINVAVKPSDEPKEPAQKKQFVILVSDPDGKLLKDELVGWVLQIPEGESPATVNDRILRASYDFNTTRRGRLLPVAAIGEALECVKAAQFKQVDVWVKTKTPVLIVTTNNQIPKADNAE